MRGRIRVGFLAFCAAGILYGPAARPAAADVPTSRQLMDEALTAAEKIADPDQKAMILNYIAMVQARSGDIPGAEQTAQTITAPREKNFAYGQIAAAMAFTGDLEHARALVGAVDDVNDRSDIYESILECQTKNGDLPGARATLTSITSPFLKSHAQEHIAWAQAAAGDVPGAEAAIATISGASDVQVEAYAGLARDRFKAGDTAGYRREIDAAKAAVKQTPNYLTAIALSQIATAQAEAGDVPGAMEIAAALPAPNDNGLILEKIAQVQIRTGNFAGAQATAQRLSNDLERVDFDIRLAEAEAKKGDTTTAKQLLKTAIDLAATNSNAPLRAIVCGSLGTAQALVTDIPTAADWCRTLTDPEMRARALMGVVRAMPNYHGPDAP